MINHAPSFAIEASPIFVLRLPTTRRSQLKIELFRKRDHARVMRINELPATLSHLSTRKTADGMHTSAYAVARFKHGDIPTGTLQIIRS
jgi:hypothetical protein